MSLTTKVYDHTGKNISSKKLPAEIFDAPSNPQLMALAVRVYLSNQRQGSKAVKTRSQVSFTGKKIWRQKGTGRARHGSKRAPIFVGGGQAHGPTGQENYKQKLTKKMRRIALLGSLSYKQQQNQIHLIKDAGKIPAKTKDFKLILKKIYKNDNPKTLFILDQPEKNIIQSTKNIPNLSTTQAKRINSYEILNAKHILIEDKALTTLINHFSSKSKTSVSITKINKYQHQEISMNIAHIIKKPVVTEKSLEAVKLNRYTFEVDAKANKHQIKEAVEEYFKVNVIKVATNINKGMVKRTGRKRIPRMQPDTKKAIVEIKSDQKIKAFEG